MVWSFAADATFEDPDWPLRHAAMAFADRMAAIGGADSGKAQVLNIMAAIAGPLEVTDIAINGATMPGRVLRFEGGGIVVAPTNPAFPVAVCLSSGNVPGLVPARSGDW